VHKDILDSRIEREKDSVKSLKNIIKSIRSMKHLNEWLYTEHKAYSCAYLKEKEDIPDNIKQSY
jgi:P2-related tail formation protein